MLKMRQIKARIKSVKNTQQITRTMEMVAAAKIKRAQERIEAARPYTFKMMDFLSDVAYHVTEVIHPLLEVHDPIEKVVVVSFTSNRGLCGSFNANIIRKTEGIISREKQGGRKVNLILIGRKGINYFRFIGEEVRAEYPSISDAPTFTEAKEIADHLIKLYLNYEADKIYLVFNHFKSLMEQRPLEHRLLPIREEVVTVGVEEERRAEFIFEPDANKVLLNLIPTYVETLVFRALLESVASEHAARRAAMKAASDNAEEMIRSLTLSFNKARQTQITQELTEIVTCAEAIKYIKQT